MLLKNENSTTKKGGSEIKHIAPVIICVVGCDGTGKSTLAKFLVDELQRRGHCSVLIWSRFNNILSKPLLALARWRGYSYYECHDGIKFGFHDFENVWWLRWPFALLQCIDVNLAVRFKLHQAKKRGDVIVFERSPWDTLADVILDTGCSCFATNLLGRLMVSSVSGQNVNVLWIARSKNLILGTRKELMHDRKLEKKIKIYTGLAKEFDWGKVNNDPALEIVRQKLSEWIEERGL